MIATNTTPPVAARIVNTLEEPVEPEEALALCAAGGDGVGVGVVGGVVALETGVEETSGAEVTDVLE